MSNKLNTEDVSRVLGNEIKVHRDLFFVEKCPKLYHSRKFSINFCNQFRSVLLFVFRKVVTLSRKPYNVNLNF